METEESKDPVGAVVEIDPDRARWRCDMERFEFESTAEIDQCPIELIGQPRAIEALQLGLSLRTRGYNIFVSGEVGTGRSTAVRRQLEEVRRDDLVPADLAYVYNPKFQHQPRLLRRRLKRLFNRAQLDENEYNILMGIIAAARQAGRGKE